MTFLRRVRKYWGVRKNCCELLGRLLPCLFPYSRTELKSFPTINSLPGSFIPGPHPRNVSLGRLSHQLILSFYFGPALGFFISFPHSCSQLLESDADKQQARQKYWLDLGVNNIWQWCPDYLLKPSIPSQRVVNVFLSVSPSSSYPPRHSRWEATSFIFIPMAFRHQDKHLNVTVWVRGLLVGLAHRKEDYPDPLASIPKA